MCIIFRSVAPLENSHQYTDYKIIVLYVWAESGELSIKLVIVCNGGFFLVVFCKMASWCVLCVYHAMPWRESEINDKDGKEGKEKKKFFFLDDGMQCSEDVCIHWNSFTFVVCAFFSTSLINGLKLQTECFFPPLLFIYRRKKKNLIYLCESLTLYDTEVSEIKFIRFPGR